MNQKVSITWLIGLLLIICCLPRKWQKSTGNCQCQHGQLINLEDFPLREGSEGLPVWQFQRFINQRHCAGIEETGIMDETTMSFLRQRLQRDSLSLNSYVKWGIHNIG